MRKRRRELQARLPRGWAIDGVTGGGHLRLIKPGRHVVFTSATPGDRRAVRNAVAQVRRAERRLD